MPEAGRLTWDVSGQKFFETGTRRGVLYPQADDGTYPQGVAWSGLTGFTKSPTGAEANKLYADDILYGTLRSAEELEGSLTAYMYPDEFAECDGSIEAAPGVTLGQQKRRSFGFSYRTVIGNDIDAEIGYKLHLIYGCMASPSEKAYATVGDSPDANEFSWDITTTPVAVADHGGRAYKPTAEIVIDSRDYATTEGQAKLTAFEDILYGKDAVTAAAAVYTATQDATKQSGKTYYTLADTVYTEFTGESFVAQTTYYELTSPAVEAADAVAARLPLPDEVIEYFAA